MSDPSTAITEVLREHTQGVDQTACPTGDCDGRGCRWEGSDDEFYAHQAAMLAPLIRERERAAWARCDDSWERAHKMSNYEPWEYMDENPYRADQLEES